MVRRYMIIRNKYSNKFENGFFGQLWPFKFHLMQQTVSENFLFNLVDTFSISCSLVSGVATQKNVCCL